MLCIKGGGGGDAEGKGVVVMKGEVPLHPRREPQFDLSLTTESIKSVFDNCVDFDTRTIYLGGDRDKGVELCYVGGMVRLERACDYLLKPLEESRALAEATMEEAWELMERGAVYDLVIAKKHTVDEVVAALINGDCVLVFPGGRAMAFSTATEEKRAVSDPRNEPAVKGAQDSFVESVRTNTSLVRRRLRSPYLKVAERVVGRQTKTPVDVLWLGDIADDELPRAVLGRLDEMDIDALLSAGDVEQYVVDNSGTPFPLTAVTQRPDRFCAGLCEGRVGLLADGLAVGFLLPGDVAQFFKTEQDRADHWMVAAGLALLRYACALITLFLPALYVAAVVFRPEMIPARLAQSIIDAKENVPFSTVFEVLLMLVAFEVVQEAGLRLPSAIGQTVSILGGLVVGSAAVEARLVSPAVLVVVAMAGIAGYTAPNQDLGGALRLWRLVLAVLASLGGLVGLALGAVVLVGHLARLETFGVPWLTPFVSGPGDRAGGRAFGKPLPAVKLRPGWLGVKNRRKQK